MLLGKCRLRKHFRSVGYLGIANSVQVGKRERERERERHVENKKKYGVREERAIK
jgi:hypothetical protein